MGDGIFDVDGAEWQYQRKVASRIFTRNELRGFMTECVIGRDGPRGGKGGEAGNFWGQLDVCFAQSRGGEGRGRETRR